MNRPLWFRAGGVWRHRLYYFKKREEFFVATREAEADSTHRGESQRKKSWARFFVLDLDEMYHTWKGVPPRGAQLLDAAAEGKLVRTVIV